jgi:CheY-like chemotaxis protein
LPSCEHAGDRTRAFESGTDALRLAPLERPLLMLLDIYLPDLGGYTVASRIRDLPATARTSIIFISYRLPHGESSAAARPRDSRRTAPTRGALTPDRGKAQGVA